MPNLPLASIIESLEADLKDVRSLVVLDVKASACLENAIWSLWELYYHRNPDADVDLDITAERIEQDPEYGL